ncbi:hypothetical protein [Xanthomonas arboricola]|uniref:hypothetical protein n=1 Tax=Xanthomonas arboricola TaxID=56448 RepID=UPI000F8DB7A9|nr:hypothetical protein [Xanthomonas arboricola]NJC03069.1 hypothetical protein [Xanthomonas arboricola]CAD7376296.1 hypothetical protein X12_000529 [Xanthomonas arboricola]
MKVSSAPQTARSYDNHVANSPNAERQSRPTTRTDGALAQLPGRPAPKRYRTASKPALSTAQAQQMRPLGMPPFHAGTSNDCGLHTIAALTGLAEADVVNGLGLTPDNIQYISQHGMTPDQFTWAITKFENSNVRHQRGSPQDLANALHELPNYEKIAIGMERHSGIGHLVAGMRQGEKLVIWDRQVNHVTEVKTREELLDYFNSHNVSSVQTWSRQ